MWGGRISIRGIYLANKKVFENMVLPGTLSKDAFINLLFAQAAELECVYTDPDLMESLIEEWSLSQQYEWNKLYAITQLNYDPITNYDRTETETINDTGSGTSTGTSSSNRVDNSENKNNVTGFNTDSYSPNTQEVNTSNGSTNVTSQNRADSEAERKRSLRAYGNIGTMTVQHMIAEEKDIANFNIYDIIVSEFINKFCVQVY